MRVLLLVLALGAVCGCSDGELAVTCKNSEAIDLVAMRNTPYVSYFSTEATLIQQEKEIKRIREWAKNQDRCVRAAYDKWLDSSERMLRQVREDNAKTQRAERGARDVPKPN